MLYLDASAILKLVIDEAESEELRKYTASDERWLTSAIARAEVVRGAARHTPEHVTTANALLARIDFIDVDTSLLDTAATLQPPTLRTLDAIHIASALLIKDDLDALVTYDQRMQAAAELHGIPWGAPA